MAAAAAEPEYRWLREGGDCKGSSDACRRNKAHVSPLRVETPNPKYCLPIKTKASVPANAIAAAANLLMSLLLLPPPLPLMSLLLLLLVVEAVNVCGSAPMIAATPAPARQQRS